MRLGRQLTIGLVLTLCWTLRVGTLAAQERVADTLRRDSVPAAVQRFTLRGVVVGDGECLPGAYIYLGEQQVAVATTDMDGAFELEGIPAGEVILSVSYIGFQTFSGTYELSGNLDLGEIRLQTRVLDEVLVKSTPPLAVQRGDTTQFNAAAVKVAADADLEELIKKLPGFQVVDGKIMAQGKEVTKIYIDGVEYSFNNPGAALKNLPANLVARIKMYDDRSEEAKFSGYDDGEKFRALSIETHEPDKMKIFGHAGGGYGMTLPPKYSFDENNYQANLSANLFDTKRQATVSFSALNEGYDDIFPDTRHQEPGAGNASQSLFANFSAKWSEKIQLGANYSFSHGDTYSASLSKQEYFPTERYENRIYDNESHSWAKVSSQSVNLRLNLKPDKRNRIILTPVFSVSDNNTRALGFSGNVENNDTINTSELLSANGTKTWRTGGDAVWMHAFEKKGRTLTARMAGHYSRTTSDQAQNNDERVLNETAGYTDTLRNLLTGNRRTAYDWSAAVTWSEPLTEHTRLSFNYTYRESDNRSDQYSRAFADRDFLHLTGIDTAQTNDLRNFYRHHNGGISYSYSKEKLSLSSGLTLSRTQMDNRYHYLGRADSLVRSRYVDLSPRVNLGYRVGEGANLDVAYHGHSSSPDATQLQDVLDVSNPLQVSRGNPDLKKSYSHQLSLDYLYAQSEKSNFLRVSFSAGQTFNQMATNTLFLPNDTTVNGYFLVRGARLTTPVNLNGEWNTALTTHYSFPWKRLKLRFDTGLGYRFSHTPSIYDDLKNFTDSHTTSLDVSVNVEPLEDLMLVFASGSSYTRSRNTTTGGAHYFAQHLNAYCLWTFWRGFYINAYFDGTIDISRKGERVRQSDNNLRATVGKKFGAEARWNVGISADDLLNTRRSLNYSFNDLYAQTSYSLRPSRTLTFTLTYRFNNMNKKQ